MHLLGFFFIQNWLRFYIFLVSLVGGLCWSHTRASKLLVIVKNTQELSNFTIVLQCTVTCQGRHKNSETR
jgi:hypothetical protein